MIILGVDYGTKRIGLASGDSSSAMTFPMASIANGSEDGAVQAVLAAAKAEGASHIVVGLPRRMHGGGPPGETERLVHAFVAKLQAASDLTVATEDERMTTGYAESVRRSAGISKKDFDRDSAAAAAILESYITRMFGGSKENILWQEQ